MEIRFGIGGREKRKWGESVKLDSVETGGIGEEGGRNLHHTFLRI